MNIKTFEKICKVKDQLALKKVLKTMLEKYYTNVVDMDGFLYVPSGNVDIMLTAHMDTVHKDKCKKIVEVVCEGKKALWSPQGIGGDDRCGVFMICELLRTTNYRPSIVFCEDEEIGGVGSDKFSTWLSENEEAQNIKYIIELDRRNGNDAVFYDCGNEEFIEYITNVTGYKEASGSFSDIGNISPVLDVASVNLSCGYYKEHTLDHYVVPDEMERTFENVKLLMSDAIYVDKFDYQEIKYDYNWNKYFGSYGGTSYGRGFDCDEYLIVASVNGMEVVGRYFGSYEACVGQFLMDNDNVCYNQIFFAGDPYDYEFGYESAAEKGVY